MNSARHHTEWLTLIEQSGPFLSLPVLLRVFPQGLEPVASDIRRRLAQAYAEWHASQDERRPDPVLHREWVGFVLGEVLGLPAACLVQDQALPAQLTLTKTEEGETLRPDLAVVRPASPTDSGSPGAALGSEPADTQRARLLVNIHPAGQGLHRAIPGRRWKASPAQRMTELLRALDLPLGLVTNGEDWLLVHAPREGTAGLATWQAGLWIEEPLTLCALTSLLGLRRFFGVPPGDTLPALFAESFENQQDVTNQLGLQVRHAVEILVQSLDRLDKERGRDLLKGQGTERLYEAGLTVMMRLVFLLFAEERDLLPSGNTIYAQHYAVSTLGAQLREVADRQGEEVLERRFDAWNRLLALFRLIYGGSEYQDLRLPAYGGELFDPGRFPFLEGRKPHSDWRRTPADPLPIHNRTVLHLLEALQLLRISLPGGGPAEARRLSFSALSVENIGTVYEGLLDHTAKRTHEAVLGLSAAKGGTTEVVLGELEALAAKGIETLVEHLKDLTKRSPAALRRVILEPVLTDEGRLRAACDNDAALLVRVQPFAGLLREDSLGYPVVITPGSVFVTSGDDRRSTGTHYTPPELTEPMVRHALDPLVYAGMAQGIAPSPETLRGPAEILALKVCDLACGSGAFLVQACRYLADKLLEAWDRLEQANPGLMVVSPEGRLSDDRGPECPIPLDPEERRLTARRLIADRCLYGVDRNPLAVEMAKLSLWLVTLQRHKPFTFLDHAIRAGDSLLGIGRLADLDSFHVAEGGQQRLSVHADRLKDAARMRAELAAIPDNSLNDVEGKALLLEEATESVRQTRLLADLVTGARLAAAGQKRTSADDLLQGAAMLDLGGMERRAADWLGRHQPFHWPLEFPEVFLGDSWERGSPARPSAGGQLSQDADPLSDALPDGAALGASGFHAFIGNPPFMGGKKITGNLGIDYREYLVGEIAHGVKGHADLCAYFFLRAGVLLRPGGMVGLLATNTLAQGDTREVGLDQLAEAGISIPRAVPSRKWPGSANLEVAHVWLHKGDWHGPWTVNDEPVAGITPYLTAPGRVTGPPQRIKANGDKSFIGSYVLGMGFVLDPDEAAALIARDPRNRDCLFPYLNGEDLNSRPDQSPSRWVINFHDWPLDRSAKGQWARADDDKRKDWLREGRVPADYPRPVAADYPALLSIIDERVKPERTRKNEDGAFALRYPLYLKWWTYADKRPKLYTTIGGMDRVFVVSQTSKYHNFVLEETSCVFMHKLVVLASANFADFACIQSRLHESWLLAHGSSLETRPVYTPSDCFETFPFPNFLDDLGAIGQRYYEHRQSIMQARQEGLTKTYNRFHDPAETADDIAKLRALHVELDQAVAAAYGWTDLALDHGFHETKQGLRYTLSEPARREVLDRLLRLNHERYDQEVVDGLHDKQGKRSESPAKKGARGRSKSAAPGQQCLF